MSPRHLGLAVLLSVSAIASAPAHACTDWDPPDWSDIVGAAPVRCTDSCRGFASSVVLEVVGLTTHGDAAGSSCGASIGPFDAGTITAVEVVDHDGVPIDGFELAPSGMTADSISCVAGLRGQGFFGRLSAPIPHGIESRLRITVSPDRGVRAEEVVAAFEGALLTLGSADSDGRFDGQHLSMRGMTVVPALPSSHP